MASAQAPRHRNLQFTEIALRESLADAMIAGMRGGSVDLAIGDMGEATAGALREMRVESLFTDELTIAVAPSHRFAERTRIGVADLCDEPFIIFRPGSALTNSLYAQTRAAGCRLRCHRLLRWAHMG